jgi:hypothetical protein
VIIRKHAGALLFITQPDHARLAADLLGHWVADDFAHHPRRDLLLLAAREHDGGWHEVDASPPVDAVTSVPLDFISVPDRIKQSIWPRAADRLAQVSDYAAALVAHHAIAIYDSRRPEPTWKAFFDEMSERREQQLARSGRSRQELHDDYRFLSVVDLLSLSFCNGWPDEHERHGCRVRFVNESIEVMPALFAETVPLRIRARSLPDRAYASSADLRATFDAAEPMLLEGSAFAGVAR